MRGGAGAAWALALGAVSWIAMAFLSGLIIAGSAHGQDLVPAPPDFKPDVAPVVVTPPGPVEDQPPAPLRAPETVEAER